MNVVLGTGRFWCPESPQFVVGVSREVVLGAGHANLFCWRIDTGELLARCAFRHRDFEAARAIVFDEGSFSVNIDLPNRRVALDLASGEIRELGGEPLRAHWILEGTEICREVEGGIQRFPVPPGFSTGWRRTPVVSADGTLLASFGHHRARVFDLRTRTYLTPVDEFDCTCGAMALAGDTLAVADQIEGIGVWNLSTGKRLTTFDLHGVAHLSSHEGLFVAAGGHGDARRYEARTGTLLARLSLPGCVDASSVDRKGNRLLTTHYEVTGGLSARLISGIWLVDFPRNQVSCLEVEADHGRRFAISPDGNRAAILDEEALRIYDVDGAWRLLETHSGAEASWLTFSPDGSKLAFLTEGRLRFLDLVHGGAPRELDGRGFADWARGPRWTEEGYLCQTADGLELRNAESLEPTAHLKANLGPCWCFESGRLAWAPGDGTLRVRDATFQRS